MITEKEKSILLSAINAYWYDHKMKLTSNTLGDIERKITQEIVDESKRLIDDFEQKLNIHGIMQAEGSDVVSGATVGNSAAGQSWSGGFECEHYKSLNQQPFYCEHCKKTIT